MISLLAVIMALLCWYVCYVDGREKTAFLARMTGGTMLVYLQQNCIAITVQMNRFD